MATKGLARWDGTDWYSVGGGLSGTDIFGQPFDPIGYDLDVYNGSLIVGGYFSHVGAQQISYLAGWNGSTWNSFPGSVTGRVYSLCRYGPDLIVGGDLPSMGNVRRYNGSTWTTLGSGTNDYVRGMSVIDGSLYVVGAFQQAGLKSSFGIARWTNPAVSTVVEAPQVSPMRAYPNPFVSRVSIDFELTMSGDYRMDVFDPQGRAVRRLSRGWFEAGSRRMTWDGKDDVARLVAPGVYFVKISGPAGVTSVKLVRQ